MKINRMIRIVAGIKSIWIDKWKVAFPLIYLLLVYLIWKVGKGYLPAFNFLSLPQLYVWIFGIFMIEMAVIGVLLILYAMGTPLRSKKIETRLIEIGFVDKAGRPPLLLSQKKHGKVVIYEFYSPRISIIEYEKFHAKIETALNVHIVAIEQGKDLQHVFIKTVTSANKIPELINWDDAYLSKGDYILQLGESQLGVEAINLNVTPHVLIGGSSGSGKSKLLKLLLMQCIKKGAMVYLADFKGGVDYMAGWHERCTMIVDVDHLLDQLTKIIEIMESRKKTFLVAGCANIIEYNKKQDAEIKRIIVACDEVAEVLDKTGLEKDQKALVSQIESKLTTIARLGRAFGIHLMLATQRPDADILKGQIKNNVDIRICGRSDKVLSQIILDNSDGAEKVPKDKQGMFLTNIGVLFKAYYVSDNCFDEGV